MKKVALSLTALLIFQIAVLQPQRSPQRMPGLCNVGEAWVPFGAGVYFMGCEKDGQHVEYLDPATHQVKVIYKPLNPRGIGWAGCRSPLTANTCSTPKSTSNPAP